VTVLSSSSGEASSSSWASPEAQQGEISGLSRSISNLGSSFGTAIAGTILISVVADGNRSYAIALAAVAVIGVIGRGTALKLPPDADKVATAE
jgi:MFS family permease